jgi:hypothetical protein
MADISQVKEHMTVVGADSVRVGTVDKVEGDRIKLTEDSSSAGRHAGHHHFIPKGLIAAIEGNTVRLSSNASVAVSLEEEENHQPLNVSTQASQPYREPTRQMAVEATPDKPTWNWNKFGVGAAAVGLTAVAAVGASLLGRKGDGDDFELRLATDETVRLISSDKVEGTAVVDRDGKKLGEIQSFMVDKYTGRVAYAIMSFGSTLGFGGSLFPLPWPVLEYDVENDGYALSITKEQMAKAPRFEADKHPEYTTAYRQSVISFYRPANVL